MDVQVKITDEMGNIMPAGTAIKFSAMFQNVGFEVLPGSITVPNVVPALGQTMVIPTYMVSAGCVGGASGISDGATGTLSVTVTTPLTQTMTSANIPIN